MLFISGQSLLKSYNQHPSKEPLSNFFFFFLRMCMMSQVLIRELQYFSTRLLIEGECEVFIKGLNLLVLLNMHNNIKYRLSKRKSKLLMNSTIIVIIMHTQNTGDRLLFVLPAVAIALSSKVRVRSLDIFTPIRSLFSLSLYLPMSALQNAC